MSGANAWTDGTVSRAAWTAAWYGFSGRSRVGKTWYSGAAANSIPAASRRLLPAPPGLQRDGVAAGDERLAEREHRERVAGVAERAEVDAQRALAARHSVPEVADDRQRQLGRPLLAPVGRHPGAS